MSLKDIKGKIKSVNRTRQVTKAMEAVSAVKMRKSQQRALSGRPYASAALSILERIAPSLATVQHPLTVARPVTRVALVAVTSDKGLCGVLNSGVLKVCAHTEETLKAEGIGKEDIDIIAFGRKAAEHYARRGYAITAQFQNVSDDVSIDDVSDTARQLVEGFMLGAYDRVYVAYSNFRSTFEQEAVVHQVLPLQSNVIEEMVKGIAPTKGEYAEEGQKNAPAFYTVEPSQDEVLSVLLPRLTAVIVYHALLESKASEHSARMVAMKNASDKSRDLAKSLTRQFNKARQAAITAEVSEIVGGIEAMASA